jgi:ribosomal protein L13
MRKRLAAKLAVVAANRLTLKHQPLFHPLDI